MPVVASNDKEYLAHLTSKYPGFWSEILVYPWLSDPRFMCLY